MTDQEENALQVAQERAANNGWPIKETLSEQLAINRRSDFYDEDGPESLPDGDYSKWD